MRYLYNFLDSLPFKKRRKVISVLNKVRSLGSSSNLDYLALLYKTDKWGKHFYTRHYFTHFKEFRSKKINLLEIGVGGYDSPVHGAGSLRMWKHFFSKANIFAIDIFDKSLLEESRIKIFQGSQADVVFLDQVVDKIKDLDIIIDDGSHYNNHVLITFKHLFPKLKDGGIYVIEDTQTSYWSEYHGDANNFNNLSTTMGFFKSLVDGLNYSEMPSATHLPSYFCKHITSIHFYHNLIFIYKGLNNEPSNILKVNS